MIIIYELYYLFMAFDYYIKKNNKTKQWLDGKSSKEFKQIALRNSSLAVDFATDADEGYYMCQANNGIGSGLKKILHINVNGNHILSICRENQKKNKLIQFNFQINYKWTIVIFISFIIINLSFFFTFPFDYFFMILFMVFHC